MIKWIGALAALSLAASPVAAQASRASAAVEEADSMAGGLSIAWIMAAIMVIGAVVFIVDDDDERDTPTSP